MFSWKKKTSLFLGRFQPFHNGHKKLFLKTLKNSGQVAILVMDSYNFGIKNPIKFKSVKKIIIERLKGYDDKYIIIKVPVVSEFIYGRKAGFKVKKIVYESTKNISSTKIRKNAKKKFGKDYVRRIVNAKLSALKKLEQ